MLDKYQNDDSGLKDYTGQIRQKKRKLFRNFSGGHFGVGVSRGKRIFEKFEV